MFGSAKGSAARSAIILVALLLVALGIATIATRLVAPHFLAAPQRAIVSQRQAEDGSMMLADLAPRDAAVDELMRPTDGAVGQSGDAAIDGEASTSSTPAERALRRPAPRGGNDEDVRRIRRGRYRVRRPAIEQAMAVEGVGTTRAVPVQEEGRMVGYRLMNVSPTLGRLGLRNGDIITHVNGRAISSPDAALAAYGGLRNAERINLRIRRGAARTGLSYIID